MKNRKQYYKELGKMAYAIAITDGTIQENELTVLHEFVLKHLALHEKENDSSGMNEAFYVDFEFDEQTEHPDDIGNAMNAFIDFVHANAESGDSRLVQRSIRLLELIANSYSRSKEKQIVSELKNKLKTRSELNEILM
jgi:hypothetical protein